MTTPITNQFTVGQSIYHRAHYDWNRVDIYDVISRSAQYVTVRDRWGDTHRLRVRVTTAHGGHTVEAIRVSPRNFGAVLYAHLLASDLTTTGAPQ
jgi:hypothetical protein